MKPSFKVSLATPFPRHSWVHAPKGLDCSLTSFFVSAERWWQPLGMANLRWFNSVYPAVTEGWVMWDLLTFAVKEKFTDARHNKTPSWPEIWDGSAYIIPLQHPLQRGQEVFKWKICFRRETKVINQEWAKKREKKEKGLCLILSVPTKSQHMVLLLHGWG